MIRAATNLVERFQLVPAGSLPLKQKPWILFTRSTSEQEAEIGEINFRRIVVRCCRDSETHA
jgi:hypothetical protein